MRKVGELLSQKYQKRVGSSHSQVISNTVFDYRFVASKIVFHNIGFQKFIPLTTADSAI